MEFTDNSSPHVLTVDQIERLLAIVLDEFGSHLTQTQFNDAVLILLEDVAGMEVVPRKIVDSMLSTHPCLNGIPDARTRSFKLPRSLTSRSR